MLTVTQQGFPNVSAALVDQNGMIQQAWLQLLIQLWNRTGGAQGGANFQSGDIKQLAYSTVPGGWILCDGTAYNRTTYSALFAAINTTWGAGDGSTTFNVPDFRDKFVRGSSSDSSVGTAGGADTVTLTVGNLATHTHIVDDPTHTHTVIDPEHTHTITDPGHVHSAAVVDSALPSGGVNSGSATSGDTGSSTTGITINSALTGITNANALTGVTNEDTGSSEPFSIVPEFAAVTYVIKT